MEQHVGREPCLVWIKHYVINAYADIDPKKERWRQIVSISAYTLIIAIHTNEGGLASNSLLEQMRLTVLREVLLQSLAKSEQAENLLFIYIKNQSYIIVVFGVMV